METKSKNISDSKMCNIKTTEEPENLEKEKTVTRDPIFTRFYTPFGLKQHNVYRILYFQAHAFALYYLYLLLGGHVARTIYLLIFIHTYLCGLGITVGSHRYWTHKTFKANLPLQILLMIMQTMALQFPIHQWALNHRIHHKYTDTDSDPHNSKRGLLFSHIGWKVSPRHPDYWKRVRTLDMPDIENDPVVRFQAKYYWTLVFIFRYAIPISILHNYYGLSYLHAVACNYAYFIGSLHATFLVNSIAHKYGDKPYDKNISPTNNAIISFFAAGEGWHNYHHTFPWDYKAAEFGWRINTSTMFIDFFAWLGWAWDLKTVSHKMLEERKIRTGDGSGSGLQDKANAKTKGFGINDENENTKTLTHQLWGWDDENMTGELKQLTKILNPQN